MYFRQILHEEKSCLSYLIGCPTKGVCAVIDPQGDPQLYIEKASQGGMQISHIIETYIHADHLSAACPLSAATGVPVCIGAGAPVLYPYQPIHDGQVLEVGNRRIRILHTPGHTPEHICLLGDDWYLLTGDTLFVGDVGRVDLTAEETNRETPKSMPGSFTKACSACWTSPIGSKSTQVTTLVLYVAGVWMAR